MYRVYAQDQQARINVGIRRRLAPLLGNSRRKIELMNGLLFSLPGTPVLYYGDEIGMGDNFYLGDRNGVRTPMQWSPDRNAGFSRANSQKLYSPVIIDPEYHYETINVEVQQDNPESLLWWTKRILSVRKQFKAFGRGTLEFLHPENNKVLAFVRAFEGETVLVVANLSRFAQHVDLNLGAFKGLTPVELFGRNPFPAISDAPYPLALGPHSFYWFSLEAQASGAAEPATALPLVVWGGSLDDLLLDTNRDALEAVLPAILRTRPWFRGRQRKVQWAEVVEQVPVRDEACLTFVRVEYTEGEAETYVMPLALAAGKQVDDLAAAVAAGPDGARARGGRGGGRRALRPAVGARLLRGPARVHGAQAAAGRFGSAHGLVGARDPPSARSPAGSVGQPDRRGPVEHVRPLRNALHPPPAAHPRARDPPRSRDEPVPDRAREVRPHPAAPGRAGIPPAARDGGDGRPPPRVRAPRKRRLEVHHRRARPILRARAERPGRRHGRAAERRGVAGRAGGKADPAAGPGVHRELPAGGGPHGEAHGRAAPGAGLAAVGSGVRARALHGAVPALAGAVDAHARPPVAAAAAPPPAHPSRGRARRRPEAAAARGRGHQEGAPRPPAPVHRACAPGTTACSTSGSCCTPERTSSS